MPITLPQGSEQGSEPTSEKDKKQNVTIQPNPAITRIYIRDAFTIGFS